MCGLEEYADASVGSLGVEQRKRTTIAVELAAKVRDRLSVCMRAMALSPFQLAQAVTLSRRTDIRSGFSKRLEHCFLS